MMTWWKCDYKGDKIRVYSVKKEYGYYHLLKSPYCEICSSPGVTTEECRWHDDYYGFDKVYAMGSYLTSSSDRGLQDLLSYHILGLKKFQNYKYPLGTALSICIKNKWPELFESNVIVPVPKVESEYKVDDETGVIYNQAVELARVMGNNLNIPIEEALFKKRPLSFRDIKRASERRKAVKGLYGIEPDMNLDEKMIILVDDVATSLSTCSECSQVLKNSGALIVNVVVAGRNELVD